MIVSLIMLMIIWMPVILKKNVSWQDITSEISFANDNRIEYGTYARTIAGRTLRSGEYHLRFTMQGMGRLIVRISSNNCASLVPDTFVLDISSITNQIDFTVYTDADYWDMELSGEESTDITVSSVLLSKQSTLDRRFTISFLIIAVMAVFVLVMCGRMKRDQLASFLLLVMIAFLASVPCLKEDLNIGDDMYYHWERLTGLVASIRSGHIPARVYPTMNNGFGGVAPIYYPDLFLYPFAMLVIAGTSMQYALHMYLILTNLVTVFGMCVFAYRITKDKNTAIIAAILYTLSPYRLTDLYTRSALGEALAMALLPIVLMMLYEVIWGDRRKWPLLAVAAALLFRAHMITTLFTAILCLAICIVAVKQIICGKRLCSLILAVVSAFCMCISILLPLWTMTKSGVTATMMMRTLALKAVEPAQLFFSTVGEVSGSWDTEHLIFRAIEVGVPLLAGTIYFIYEDIQISDRKWFYKVAQMFTLFGIVAAAMTTTWFPWEKMEVWTKYISKYIQFPWRLLLVTVCLCTIPAAIAYSHLGEKSVFAVMVICLAFALPLERMQTLNTNIIPYGRTVEWMQLFGDYNFEGTISSKAVNRDIRVKGEVEIKEVHRAGTELKTLIDTTGETSLILPLYAFDGYEVLLNGDRIDWYRGEENRLVVDLPSDSHGELSVRYIGNPIWHVGEIISLLTFTLMVILASFQKKKKTA